MVGAGLPHALVDGARDDIAGREIRQWVHAGHERDTVAVAQHRALAPQRLREERSGHRRVVQRRRMELDEFEIGARDPGAERERDAVTGRQRRIRGDREALADTARREDDVRGPHRLYRPVGTQRSDPARVPALDDQFDREPAFADLDRRGLDRGHQRAFDLGARRVAAGVHDARERVAAFPCEEETPAGAVLVGVELGTQLGELPHAVPDPR